MKQKLYKISFKSKVDWEAFKTANLITKDEEGNEILKTGFTLAGEGHLPKAPAADWVPDPDKPDDNGWGNYSDYSVDVISNDYTDIFNDYLIAKPKHSLRSIVGGDFEVIYK